MLYEFIAVFLGGGLGSLIRFLTTKCSQRLVGLPHFGTFAVNILGCFVIGVVFGLLARKTTIFPQHIKLFLTVGFLGGLTTFSTFNFEVFELIKNGKIIHGTTYLFLTCFIGLASTLGGMYLAHKI